MKSYKQLLLKRSIYLSVQTVECAVAPFNSVMLISI